MKPKTFSFTVIIMALVASVATALFFWQQQHATGDFALLYTLTAFNGVVTLGAVPLFVIGLRRFSQEFRRAYSLFCGGVVLFGASQMLLWLFAFWRLDNTALSAVLIGTPYALSFAVQYMGLRSFAKVLRIQTMWASLRRLLAAGVVLALAALFIPHAYAGPEVSEVQFDATLAGVAFFGLFVLFSAGTVWHVRRAASTMYQSAMRWLFASLVALTTAAALFVLEEIIVGRHTTQLGYAMSIAATSAGSLLLLRAGYAHNYIGTTVTTKVVDANRVSSLEIVTYTASLVSNPSEIDAQIEVVRSVSAMLAPGQSVDVAGQKRLMDTYLQLEIYLTTKEPAQHFTVEGLRQQVTNTLHLTTTAEGTFWSQLPPAAAPTAT